MRRLVLISFLLLVLLLPSSSSCLGPKIDKGTAVWDPNQETDLAGYYLYWKPVGGAFADDRRVVVAPSPNPSFDLISLNLASGVYVVAVSAYNTAGNESGLSNEAEFNATIPGQPVNLHLQ